MWQALTPTSQASIRRPEWGTPTIDYLVGTVLIVHSLLLHATETEGAFFWDYPGIAGLLGIFVFF